MREWLPSLLEILARGEAAMLVHVAELKGSGPREAGAQMLVSETGSFGTIGGGELEHSAMLAARDYLRQGRAGLLKLALGPELNQCCGGFVTLALEPFAPADRAWVEKLARAAAEPPPAFRTVSFGAGGSFTRDWSQGDGDKDFAAEMKGGVELVIRERMNPRRDAVWLFGAGHVGTAVARALQPLGFDLTWVDGRAGQFPDPPPAGVRTLSLAMPELIVDESPAGAFFLVMTHSHPLDETICEAILRRGDFAYLGLIGSKTKRARFVRRLKESGIDKKMLERLTCPIGIPQIRSKAPAAIAAGIAADLILRREARMSAVREGAHGS